MAKWGEIKCPRCEMLEAKLAKAVEERDEALNQLDSARHSVAVLEKRVKTFCDGWGIADKGRLEAEAKLSKCEALLAKAVEALQAAADDLSGYVGYSYADEYRITLAAVSETHKLNKERSDEKGQDDE